jgi:hypothetical protein
LARFEVWNGNNPALLALPDCHEGHRVQVLPVPRQDQLLCNTVPRQHLIACFAVGLRLRQFSRLVSLKWPAVVLKPAVDDDRQSIQVDLVHVGLHFYRIFVVWIGLGMGHDVLWHRVRF